MFLTFHVKDVIVFVNVACLGMCLCVYGCTHTLFYDLHGKVLGERWSWLFLLLFDAAFLLFAAALGTPGLLAFELPTVLWEAPCLSPAAQN